MALEWRDIDLAKRQLSIARSQWKAHVTAPKGGHVRHAPLTERLLETLKAARHLRGPRVICDEKGQPLTQKVVQLTVRRVATRAHVKPGVHILRHTFCSHLAMRGAPARVIQELAGHQDLTTTQRYRNSPPTLTQRFEAETARKCAARRRARIPTSPNHTEHSRTLYSDSPRTIKQEVYAVRTFDRITQRPDLLAGRATIRGLRISVAHVVNLVANGMTPAQIVEELPDLQEEDIRQALAYAAALAQDELHPLRA
jgi:uncharacterized protein (DUF433 family)